MPSLDSVGIELNCRKTSQRPLKIELLGGIGKNTQWIYKLFIPVSQFGFVFQKKICL